MVDRNGDPIETPVMYGSVPRCGSMGDEGRLRVLLEGEGSKQQVGTKDDVLTDALSWSSRNSHLPTLTYLLSKDADLESKSYGGLRPLHHACHVYNEDVIKVLLEKKADPNSKDDAGNTPLHYACRRGVLALCTMLLEAKADVTAKNSAGMTPLHFAANSGQISIVQWLLTKEADANEPDKNGDTPLHVAARVGFKNIVQALLGAGAKQVTNRGGKTPLEVSGDKDCTKLLGEQK